MRKSPLAQLISLMIACFLLLSLFAAVSAKEIVLSKKQFVNEPVEISNIKVRGKNILFGRTFSTEDGWMKGMTFDVRNVSEKNIVFIEIAIRFDSLNSQADSASASISRGFFKKFAGDFDAAKRSITIRPSDLINFEISEKNYNNILTLLKAAQLTEDACELNVSIERVVFDDETMWRAGFLLRRDANDLRKWNVVKRPEENAFNKILQRNGLSDTKSFPAKSSITFALCGTNLGTWTNLCGESPNQPPCSFFL